MRRFTVLFAFVLAFGVFGVAQMQQAPMEIPRTELYIGYAYQHADVSGSGFVDSTSMNGFAFEFNHYFKNNLGYVVDISRTSNGKVDSTGIKYTRASYMGGLAYRLHRIAMFTPSIHAMGGVDHDDLTVPYTNTTLDYRNLDPAAAAGISFDANLSKHIAVRVAQVDYIYTNHYNTNESSFRYTGGLVVRF